MKKELKSWKREKENSMPFVTIETQDGRQFNGVRVEKWQSYQEALNDETSSRGIKKLKWIKFGRKVINYMTPKIHMINMESRQTIIELFNRKVCIF